MRGLAAAAVLLVVPAMVTGTLAGLALAGDATEGVWIEPGPDGDELYQAVGIPIFAPGRTVIYGVLVAALPTPFGRTVMFTHVAEQARRSASTARQSSGRM